MLVHLLVTALVSGIHSGNMSNSSEEVRLEGSLQERNLVFIKKPNVTVEPDWVPSPWDDADQLAERESEVGLLPNHKVTTEDDEGFQDPLLPLEHCLMDLLEMTSHIMCQRNFQQSMEAIGAEHWCSFQKVIGPYNNLTSCMENLSGIMKCFYPNPIVQDFFLRVHDEFFVSCSEEELLLSDAPHGVVVVLTLVPVTLIPLLVYLVVWRSNGRE